VVAVAANMVAVTMTMIMTFNIQTSSWQKWRIINYSRKNSEHVATR
jgi:hypothetical protein